MRLLVLTALLSPGFAQESVQAPVVRRGDVFEVACRFGDAGAAELALAAAEAAWPLASALYGVAAHPEEPYTIQLFQNPEDYRAVERVVTGGRFRNNLAFTSWDSRKTYITVQPECSEAIQARVGLPALTRRLLLHEATHLVCYHAMANYRAHPEWIAEGLANWVADEVMRAKGWSSGRETEPLTATDIHAVQSMLEAGTLPSVDQIFADDLAAMFEGQRYALAWTFVDFLMRTRRAAFTEVLRELGTLSGSDLPARLKLVLEQRLAPDGTAALDAEYHAYLRAFVPEWRVSVRSLASLEGGWLQLAFRRTAASAWLANTDLGAAFTVQGELELLDGEWKSSARILLGQRATEGGHQENYAYVEFEAGFGVRVRQAQLARTDKGWSLGVLELEGAEVESVRVGEPIAFRVEVAGGQLRVFVDKELVLDEALDPETLSGAVGLGAAGGSAVLWRAFEVERFE